MYNITPHSPGYTWSQEGELCTDFTSTSVIVSPTEHICDRGLTCVKCAEDHTAQCMKSEYTDVQN